MHLTLPMWCILTLPITDMADYSIKISGPDLNFERSINLDKVNKIIQVCMDNFKFVSQGNEVNGDILKTIVDITPKVEEVTSRQPSLSIAEYYKKFNPKRNPDKILVFASYSNECLELKKFNIDDIKGMFSEVGEKTPKNFMRDFKWAKVNGWFDKFPNSDEYYITKSGKKVLENNFHPDIIKKTKMPDGMRSRKKKNKQKDAQVS